MAESKIIIETRDKAGQSSTASRSAKEKKDRYRPGEAFQSHGRFTRSHYNQRREALSVGLSPNAQLKAIMVEKEELLKAKLRDMKQRQEEREENAKEREERKKHAQHMKARRLGLEGGADTDTIRAKEKLDLEMKLIENQRKEEERVQKKEEREKEKKRKAQERELAKELKIREKEMKNAEEAAMNNKLFHRATKLLGQGLYDLLVGTGLADNSKMRLLRVGLKGARDVEGGEAPGMLQTLMGSGGDAGQAVSTGSKVASGGGGAGAGEASAAGATAGSTAGGSGAGAAGGAAGMAAIAAVAIAVLAVLYLIYKVIKKMVDNSEMFKAIMTAIDLTLGGILDMLIVLPLVLLDKMNILADGLDMLTPSYEDTVRATEEVLTAVSDFKDSLVDMSFEGLFLLAGEDFSHLKELSTLSWNGLESLAGLTFTGIEMMSGVDLTNLRSASEWTFDSLRSLSETTWSGLSDLAHFAWDGLKDIDKLPFMGLRKINDISFQKLLDLNDLQWSGLFGLDKLDWEGLFNLDGISLDGIMDLADLDFSGLKDLANTFTGGGGGGSGSSFLEAALDVVFS